MYLLFTDKMCHQKSAISFFLLYFTSFCSEAPQSRESTVLCNSLKVFKSLNTVYKIVTPPGFKSSVQHQLKFLTAYTLGLVERPRAAITSRYIDAKEPIGSKLLFLSPICSRRVYLITVVYSSLQ